MCYGPRPLLGDLEVLGLQIVEEITALEVFHHDVNEVRVLEHVIKSDDIGMLAHFEHLDFSLEQFHILERKVFLLDDLNSDFLA